MKIRSFLTVSLVTLASACSAAPSTDTPARTSESQALTVVATSMVPTIAGSYSLLFGWDGLQRAYRLYLPTGYDQNRAKKYPVLAIFHGANNSADNFATANGMPGLLATADTEGYVVVFLEAEPGGTTTALGTWEFDTTVRDDFGYTAGVLDLLLANLNVKRSKVYAAGFSMGGAFVHRLGIVDASRYGGIAVVEGFYAKTPEIPNVSPAAATNLPVLIIHADNDPVVPYAGGTGGTGATGFTSAADAYTTWYANNRCSASSSLVTGTWVDTESTDCTTTGATIPVTFTTYHPPSPVHVWQPGGFNTSTRVMTFFDSL